MKIKLIHSKYDETTGVSIVTVRTQYGEFTGVARVHPEDEAQASSYLGCEIAERRATIKALKQKEKELVIKAKTLRELNKDMEQRKDYSHNSSEARFVRKRINIIQKQILDTRREQSEIEDGIYKTIENRESILERFSKKDK